MTIPTRPLGTTGFDATILGFGAMELRGINEGPTIDDSVATTVLNAVLDSGINFIDTSPDYGRSEELIGANIAHRRDEYFLASKCGCFPVPEGQTTGPFEHDFSGANVRAGVENSLRRMGTDHLDLVQVHMAPSRSQLEADGTVEAMQTLRDEGKVRFIGMSGRMPTLAEHIAMDVFDAFQIPYSALQREHETLIEQAAAGGAGIIIRGGAARGTTSEEKDWNIVPLNQEPGVARSRWEDAKLDELLDGMSRHEFTLRFTFSLPQLATTIVGTSNPAHLASNVAIAGRGPLPDDLYAEAKRRLDEVA